VGNLSKVKLECHKEVQSPPIIAKISLDGLEKCVLDSVKNTKQKNWASKVTTVRYADDFVITGASPRLLKNRVKPAVEKF
jgi:RNA-directed DNA polymerase